MKRWLLAAVLGASLLLPALLSRAAEPAAEAEDPVAAARALARAGKRQEAIGKLELQLESDPDDSEARVALGTILSWEGHYDDARKHLERVLEASPLHYDALRALINVELWSGHPERAEQLANRGLGASSAPDLLLARARARTALGRTEEARADVELARSIDPTSVEAASLGRSLAQTGLKWRVGSVLYYDWFSDDRPDWKEAQLNLKRQMSWGSLIGHYWRVEHFDTKDGQLELEAWPRIRTGTYASLDATVSTDPDLVYSDWSVGGEIYQSLGHGFEGSFGYRFLNFDGSGVDIWTTTLSKYLGNWFLTGRVYYVPNSLSDSWSYYLQGRRYFGDGTEYFGVRVGRGTYKEQVRTTGDLVHLSSNSISAEFWKQIGERFELTAGAAWSTSGRADLSDLKQYGLSVGLYYRF